MCFRAVIEAVWRVKQTENTRFGSVLLLYKFLSFVKRGFCFLSIQFRYGNIGIIFLSYGRDRQKGAGIGTLTLKKGEKRHFGKKIALFFGFLAKST